MIRNLILSAALTIGVQSLAQDDGFKWQWSLGAGFSPDLYFGKQEIRNPDGPYSGQLYLPPRFGYTADVKASVLVKPEWQFSLGAMYSMRDASEEYYCHVCDFDPFRNSIRQRYFEVPVAVTYRLSDPNRKIVPQLSAGFAFGGIGYWSILMVPPKRFTWFTDNILLSGQIGVGADMRLGKRLIASLNSIYRHGLATFSENEHFKMRSLSLVTSLAYRLNLPND